MLNSAAGDTLRHVKYFHAPGDHRAIAIFISGQFDEFEKFPSFMETEEEIQHVREAYKVADPLLERTMKAHVTDNSWPLQIILLQRNPGGTTLPHYHVSTELLPDLPTRHQVLICQSGGTRLIETRCTRCTKFSMNTSVTGIPPAPWWRSAT